MIPPRPPALRLLTRARGRPPGPPLGLRVWSPEATAVAVLLDTTGVDLSDPSQVAAQIPPAAGLPPATPVFVLGSARGGSALRWLRLGRVSVGRAPRCAALVALGYVGVGAAIDPASGGDLAWGFSSPC